jgi:rubrerythrin
VKGRYDMINYDARKLVQTIIMTEENTTKFYKTVSEKASDRYVKNIFLRLSEDEEMHVKMYADILENLPNNGKLDLPEDEVEYMEILITSNIFANERAFRRFVDNDLQQLIEKIERDSILLRVQLKRLFPGYREKEMDMILKDEKKHLKIATDKHLGMILPTVEL